MQMTDEILTTVSTDKFFNGEVIHNRLKVFKHKGLKCVRCSLTGNIVRLIRKGCGSIHLDLYSNDTLMTIDHILPKSKGGNNHLNNLQPMCCNCNLKKGNKIEDNYKEGKT